MNNSNLIIEILDHPYITLCLIYVSSLGITKLLYKLSSTVLKNGFKTNIYLVSYFICSILSTFIVYYIGSLGALRYLTDVFDIGFGVMTSYNYGFNFTLINLIISFIALLYYKSKKQTTNNI